MKHMHDQPPQTSDLPPSSTPEDNPSFRALIKCWDALKEESLDFNQGLGIAALLVANTIKISGEEPETVVRLFLSKLAKAVPGVIQETNVPRQRKAQSTPLNRCQLKLGGN